MKKSNYIFLNKYTFNVDYATEEEYKVFHAFKRERNRGRIKNCYEGSVIYGANYGNDMYGQGRIFFHALDIWFFMGHTIVTGSFGGIRDIVKGRLTPDEISERNLGITEKELIEKLYKRYA